MNESQLPLPAPVSLRIGLLVNPWAGVGGPAGLRGSDGASIREQALARGSAPSAGGRATRFLTALAGLGERIDWLTWGGDMGATVLQAAGLAVRVCGEPAATPSSAADTVAAARGLADAGASLLLFVGGDGTARDVCSAIGLRIPALGIPAGVKMYSGVFAVSPEAAADVVRQLLAGVPVPLRAGEVRDIDEDAFRHDLVASRFFGELSVPAPGGLVQHVKCGSPPVEAIARQEIAAGVIEQMEPGVLYLVGTGTTPKAILDALSLTGSLLGIDAVVDKRLLASDLDAHALLALLAQYPARQLLITVTGGQGFLFGRGNQQLSADVVRQVGIDNLLIVATADKLAALAGRPLLVDTGDIELDHALAGLRPVLTGYDQRVLYRVAPAETPG